MIAICQNYKQAQQAIANGASYVRWQCPCCHKKQRSRCKNFDRRSSMCQKCAYAYRYRAKQQRMLAGWY